MITHQLIQQSHLIYIKYSIPSFYQIRSLTFPSIDPIIRPLMNDLILPPLNPLLTAKIQPRLMKDTYKKVHIYLFDFDLMLGKGSFSKVYKGINLNTNQQVAVKVVQMTSITTPKLKQLLLQQIDILMKIKNEKLIKCFEVLSSAKNTYIVMELCTYDFGGICEFIQKQLQIEKSMPIEKQFRFPNMLGQHEYQNLQQTNNRGQAYHQGEGIGKNRLSEESQALSKSINSIQSTKSVQIEQSYEENDCQNQLFLQSDSNLKEVTFYPFIKQIFQGLQYLQNQNIVHRDIKLSNIFLTASKSCKIGDFGFATIIPTNQIQIKDTCCIGSPLYMSPQSYIENVYSLKSDIWSFGILIFQMIFGNPPHWNCPTHDILKCEIRKPIDFKKFQRLSRISDQLKEVLQGCLQVDVRRRFSIKQIKQTKLFKRLFYQPLESKVIVSSRHKHQIDQSSVQVFGVPNTANEGMDEEYKEFKYNNYSAIQKVKEGSIDALGYKINRLSKTQQHNIDRKYERNQTFMPIANDCSPFYERMQNNSFTDRANQVEIMHQKRATTSTKLQNNSHRKQELNQMKFKSTDLTGNIFRDAAFMADQKRNSSHLKAKSSEQKQFLYKNSEQMQKFLKQMTQNRSIIPSNNTPNLIIDQSPITFTDLSNIISHTKNISEDDNKKQQESPKFASTFSGPFFSSSKYQKMHKPYENRKSTELTNYSMLQCGNKKLIKPSTSYSPRNNSSYTQEKSVLDYNYSNKQNCKNQTLAPQLNSNSLFSPPHKPYSIPKQSQKYQYKTKILDKCLSTPKFQNYQNNEHKKTEEDEEKTPKYMTASTFLGSSNQVRSPRVKNPPASNIIKQFNLKEQIQFQSATSRKTHYFTPKNFDGTNNLLYQFSTKNKEQSQIQKKTYWKGNNTKNFIGSQGDKPLDYTKNQIPVPSNSQYLNQMRNHSHFFTANSKQIDQYEKKTDKKHKITSKEVNQGDSVGISVQTFKLLNGQLIIQDACELVNFSRLLHKLSFMTENNGNSILLLQYSIQILRNLQEKCDNFQIKYHYDSSTNNATEIREAFKSNEIYLNNLMAVNQKECYAIKRENPSVYKSNSAICNKTFQLKAIIESYIKKYLQRKEALIKLFECNVLFQNLSNKVKQARQFSDQSKNDKPTLKKRTSMNCERGFLNFSRLEKVIEDIQMQFKTKKQSEKNKFVSAIKSQIPQGPGDKILLKTASCYIQAVQKCLNEHSFFHFIAFARVIMTLSNEKFQSDLLKDNKMGPICPNTSIIERLLQANDAKNSLKSPNDRQTNSDTFSRNYSLLVVPSFK